MLRPSPAEKLVLAQKGAHILYRHGAQSVWLFGSLAGTHRPDGFSDLDYAVAGLPAELCSKLAAELFRLLRCWVDIVPVENAPPSLRASIFRRRVLLPREDDASGWHGATSAPAAVSTLYRQRLTAVVEALRRCGARRVLDVGCGRGWLIQMLACDPAFTAVAGLDLSEPALSAARKRLRTVLEPERFQRVRLMHGLATWRDPRLLGYDAVTVVEVIEHLADPQRAACEDALFGYSRPATLVITTPNADYNRKWGNDAAQRMRIPEHRFEWSPAQFRAWAREIAVRFGYGPTLWPVGPVDRALGPPTQMAVFRRDT